MLRFFRLETLYESGIVEAEFIADFYGGVGKLDLIFRGLRIVSSFARLILVPILSVQFAFKSMWYIKITLLEIS